MVDKNSLLFGLDIPHRSVQLYSIKYSKKKETSTNSNKNSCLYAPENQKGKSVLTPYRYGVINHF